jgi:electron transfer flavoprotein alpha/beta subunit
LLWPHRFNPPAALVLLQGQMLAALLAWPQATFASKVEVDAAAGSVKVGKRWSQLQGLLQVLAQPAMA